jgi:hypothetical protein
MVLDIQTVHHILKKYISTKCKQTICLHTDLTSTLIEPLISCNVLDSITHIPTYLAACLLY